ncbi:MAG: DEAD/DEAH box helicase [Egibacteraceae bacterium]
MASFDALGVAPDLVAALRARGITVPLPIQALTITDALAGRDVCGKAKTGSGKTLAFGLPLIERTSRSKPRRPRGLVLVPTRELANQVSEVLTVLAQTRGLRVAAVYGGTSLDRQVKALRRGVDLMIATPGRLIDLGERGAVSVTDVRVLVLDEADRMVDMGFLPQVEWVLRRLPAEHQTLLFSATLDHEVDRLVRTYAHDPVHHEVASCKPTVEEMEHRFLKVHDKDKLKVAAAVARGVRRTLVFVRTRRGADRLAVQFRREGVTAGILHGGLSQAARQRALHEFRTGRVGLLVATDVAARGLDIDGIDIVMHYDPPEDRKAYLHRSGRTARAGEKGMAVSLLRGDQVADAKRLCRQLGIAQPLVELFSNDVRLADLTSQDWELPTEAATGTDGRPLPIRATAPRSHGRRRRQR